MGECIELLAFLVLLWIAVEILIALIWLPFAIIGIICAVFDRCEEDYCSEDDEEDFYDEDELIYKDDE